MPDEPDPPRKVYGLKAKEFERVNREEPGSTPPPANDVFSLQRELREREIAAGMDELKPVDRPRSKRRRRDFWLLLLGGNGLFAGSVAVIGPNPVTLIYAFSGAILFTVGLTWVMWFVMDDY